MSILGKRKSRKMLENKMEAISTDKDVKMSPIPTFQHELVLAHEGAEDNDKLYAATAVKADEGVPSGSLGCYIPEGRPGIYERLAKMEESIKSQNTVIKNQNKVIQNLQALELNNRIVQLVYGLTHAKIIEMVPNCHEILKYKHCFRFEDVLDEPKVDVGTKNKIKMDPSCIKLKELMNGFFWDIVRNRNAEIHPRYIDLAPINEILAQINGDNTLKGRYLVDYNKAKKIYEDVLALNELQILIDVFNDFNENK